MFQEEAGLRESPRMGRKKGHFWLDPRIVGQKDE